MTFYRFVIIGTTRLLFEVIARSVRRAAEMDLPVAELAKSFELRARCRWAESLGDFRYASGYKNARLLRKVAVQLYLMRQVSPGTYSGTVPYTMSRFEKSQEDVEEMK